MSFMQAAILQAKISLKTAGIPIGAVLVHDTLGVVGRGHNERVQHNSTIEHAEMVALENAGRRTASFYKQCTMFTTLSPCIMCAGAILLYGIPKVVIGENVNFMGAEGLLKSRGVDILVLQDPLCIDMLRLFIKENPELWHEDIGA